MKSIKLVCPLFIDLPRKTKKDKRVYLNMNIFHNLNPFDYNKVKIEISKLIGLQLLNQPTLTNTPIQAKFTFYNPVKGRRDVGNVCSIVEKLVSDALVDHNILSDDDSEVLTDLHFKAGGYDKGNGRVEIIYSES